MYEHKKPYGFIAENSVTGIMARKDDKFYLKDNIGNFLEIDKETFEILKERGIPEVWRRTKRN